MTAARRAIVEAAVAAVSGGVAALGGRVASNRVRSWQHSQLPAATVFTRGEAVSVIDEAPLLYRRDLELVVQVVDHANDVVDAQLDLLGDAIETAMHHSVRLGGLVAILILSRVEGPEIDEDGNRPIGGLNIVFTATYEQEVGEAPEQSIDLERLHVEFETHAPRTGPEAVADIELEVATP